MTIIDVLTLCHQRGVSLVIRGGQLNARGQFGAVNEALRRGLVEHKEKLIEYLGEGQHPDPLLPDRVVYPASLPNTIEAFSSCYEAQRVKAA